jgi:hypothetical protein
MGARNRVGIGLSYQPARTRILKILRSPGIDSRESIPGGTERQTHRVIVPAHQSTEACEIDSLESIPRLHKLVQIWARATQTAEIDSWAS